MGQPPPIPRATWDTLLPPVGKISPTPWSLKTFSEPLDRPTEIHDTNGDLVAIVALKEGAEAEVEVANGAMLVCAPQTLAALRDLLKRSMQMARLVPGSLHDHELMRAFRTSAGNALKDILDAEDRI